jgi:cytochrome o ubiquinol oxidase subunit 1
MGATRRLDNYDASTGWQPFFIMALSGGVVIMIGVALQVVQIIASFIQKRRLLDTTGDPWDGRTLEWATASPPPSYNFSVIPEVSQRDAYWEMKRQGLTKPVYVDIHMPRNTASGIYIAAFAFLVGFGFVWEIVWLIVLSMLGMIVSLILRTFNDDTEYTIPAAEVEKLEEARAKKHAEDIAEYNPNAGEDMGLREFIVIAIKWAFGLFRRKR